MTCNMGKSKKRNFYKCKYLDISCMSRQRAIDEVIADLNNDIFSKKAYNKISLFGLSAEELSENGAKFEDLIALQHVLN